jgi:hypothetical protein
MKRAIPILCAAAALIAPQAAEAATQSASSGNVSATFTYHGTYPNYHGETMSISRAGQVVYDQPVNSPDCLAGSYECAPGAMTPGASSVHIVNLESTSEPNVVLDLYTGGAHCCWVEQVFSFDAATSTYLMSERDFWDVGDQMVDLRHDGLSEFLSADERFEYAFTDYAASGAPIQILSFAGGHFTDITRQFPKLIARDAAVWMKAFKAQARQHYPDSVGVIAAWAADEDLLGHSKLVSRYLHQQARAGHLNAAFSAGGMKFVAKLQKFLRRRGYLR